MASPGPFSSNGGNGTGRPRRGANRLHLLVGSVLVGLGALALGEAVGLRDEWPGARLLPALVGLALVLLGGAHLTGPALEPPKWPDASGRRRLAFVAIVLSFYVFGLPTLGFLTATALFLFALLRGLGSLSWVTAGVVAGAVALGSQVVFRHWLVLPLPSGLLGL